MGDPRLHGDLSMRLASGSCRIIHFDTPGEAASNVTDAALIVVNALSPETESFCRRLRADPITGSTPLLVRGTTHQRAPWADEVLPGDTEQVIEVLRSYLPEFLTQAPNGTLENASAPAPSSNDFSPDDFAAFDDDTAFDLDESTVIWRRPEGVDDWPQPPPEQQPGEPVLDFTRGYAGYVNSLVEAIAAPERYSQAQHVRIDEMAHRVVGTMDAILSTTQDAVNAVLREGDLQGMHELSAAKNVLFEKLQYLRKGLRNAPSAGGATGAPAPKTPSLGDGEAPEREAPGREAPGRPMTPYTTGPHAPPSFSSTPPGDANATNDPPLDGTEPQRKSRLTLAAEAKDKERNQTIQKTVAVRRATSRARAKNRSAGGGLFRSRIIWLSLIAIVVIAGGSTYFFHLRRNSTPSNVDPNNHSPLMRYVTIQETPGCVIARPRAEDTDGDRVSFALKWTIDGKPLAGFQSTRLPKRFYRVGQRVVVEITPSDGKSHGKTMASQPLSITGHTTPHPKRRPTPKP
ncbi:MAG: hypothetical protein KAI47_15225 [Deltaproteobacteria bacterium]|nr:hypothetical protein [Deltaproteobacteria bacterium]